MNSLSAQSIKPKCLDGNCKNKIGTFIYSDSSIYVGSFVDKLRSGQGKITFKNKSSYDGQWLNDKRNGFGVYVDSLGNVFEGTWVDDFKSGKGKFTDVKGDVYEGSWTNDILTGQIVIRYKNKSLYEGEYNQGIRGKGKFTYSDGSVYTGDFAKNKRSGYGEMIYSYGLTYKGNWVSNEVDGQGQFYLTSTQFKIAEGVWKTDKTNPSDAKFISADGYMICYYANKNLYYGKTQEGLQNSSGTIYYSNGDVYEGNFVKGVYHGKGKLTLKDKSEYNGNWKSGQKDGFGTLTKSDRSKVNGYWKADKYLGENNPDVINISNDLNSLQSNWIKESNLDENVGYYTNTESGISWKYFDQCGKLLQEYTLDNEGKLHGKKIEYFENGQIATTSSFVHGIDNDFRIRYHENGQFKEKDYVTKRTDFDIEYAENGQLTKLFFNCTSGEKATENTCKLAYRFDKFGLIRANLGKNLPEGTNIIKWTNGKICFEGKILNGTQHGKWTFYYEDGTKSSETYFKNGIQDSIYLSWFQNGKLNTKTIVDINSIWLVELHGQKKGYTEKYYSNGQLKYVETELTKSWFHNNGHILKIINCIKFDCIIQGEKQVCVKLKDGEFIEYNYDGSISEKGSYQNQRRVGFWIEKQTIDESEVYNRCIRKEGNYLNELDSKALTTNEDQIYINEIEVKTLTEYDEPAITRAIKYDYFIGGYRTGIWKYFTSDGLLIGEENYLNGRLNGVQKIYSEKGKIESETLYKNGSITEKKEYFESGKIKAFYKYKDNEVIEETFFDE